MTSIAVTDLKRPRELRSILERAREVVVTKDGRPFAIMIGVDPEATADTLREVRRALFSTAILRARRRATTAPISAAEIQAEVDAQRARQSSDHSAPEFMTDSPRSPSCWRGVQSWQLLGDHKYVNVVSKRIGSRRRRSRSECAGGIFHMIVAGIRETKTRLSSYLAAVRAGEEVLITDRGRPVARIIPEPARTASLTEQLAGLAAAGIVTLPTEPAPRARPIPQRVTGTPLSDIVREDRR